MPQSKWDNFKMGTAEIVIGVLLAEAVIRFYDHMILLYFLEY